MLFRSVPQVEVILDIDANGILLVTAKDKASGKEKKIRIEGGSQLTKEEIENMKAEAEANAESDKIEREKVDKLNGADNLIFQTEKQIKEFDEKLTEDDKRVLGIDLEELKKAYTDQNVDAIDESSKKLSESWHTISTKLYEQSQSEAEPTNESSEDIQDVSYEDVSEETSK